MAARSVRPGILDLLPDLGHLLTFRVGVFSEGQAPAERDPRAAQGV
jgi:hypothetical protein